MSNSTVTTACPSTTDYIAFLVPMGASFVAFLCSEIIPKISGGKYSGVIALILGGVQKLATSVASNSSAASEVTSIVSSV